MGGHLKNSAGSHRAPALADASSTQFSFFFFPFFFLLQLHNNTPHTHGTNHLFPGANSRSYLKRKEWRNTRCFTFPPEKQNIDALSIRNQTADNNETKFTFFFFFSWVSVVLAHLRHLEQNMGPLSISHKAIDSERFLTDNIKACVESARPLMKMMKTFSFYSPTFLKREKHLQFPVESI